jgi:hypothetical protein
MDEAVRTKIKEAIVAMEPGSIIFPSDFFQLGSVSAVNMALSRLNNAGFIKRLAKGIYTLPKHNPLFGSTNPSIEEIAEAISKKEKVKIRPTGLTALNKLGLSTQVPMKVVYLTDGNPRKIKLNRGEITFRRTTPKIMAINGEKTFLAVQAMTTLGKGAVNDKIFEQLYNVLKNEDIRQIREDAKLAPAWISSILYKLSNKIAHQ